MRKIKFIVIHCTAGPLKQTTKAIQAYWRGLGWKTDGYHRLIGEDKTEQLVSFENPSNGVKGFNSKIINICYKGGDSKGTDTRTDFQKDELLDSINKALKWCAKHHTPEELAAIRILGHRDFSRDLNHDGKISKNEWEKTCPCFDAEIEYEWIVGTEALKHIGESIKK
ncbi:N-acetylmuramoyl-L-alanine amidase [Sphingobacterium kitahiroshimense]|uniref:peptidoglycan recognition protein family protein n=1 Tax=Sphingobacterium sp. B16(2022) TaxID=2914044 RepID=UPI0014387CA5|nr:N-acetylmuramoyl-L-alanine amidase [Sphingobacterium sp. B16(2022)]NJI75840.1 N-acetylmuramoyl-L-alanine amidase [Sphingobacterium sp. B16(2022)]